MTFRLTRRPCDGIRTDSPDCNHSNTDHRQDDRLMETKTYYRNKYGREFVSLRDALRDEYRNEIETVLKRTLAPYGEDDPIGYSAYACSKAVMENYEDISRIIDKMTKDIRFERK